jgi:hypothetical protein
MEESSPMEGIGDDGLRDRWQAWVKKALGGTEAQIEAATLAAMGAIRAGGTQDQAVEHARAAWNGKTASAVAQPTPPQQAAPVPSPSPQRTPVSGAEITGKVAGFQARNEMFNRSYIIVWNFRVERAGVPPLAVEMRGYAFDGAVANGDEVRLAATPGRGGIVRAKSLENLTSNATVGVSRGALFSPSNRTAKVVRAVFAVVFLIIVLSIIATAVTVFTAHGGP